MRLIDADALWHDMETAEWYNNADRDEVAESLVLSSPTIGGWISVEDRLPETRHAVLVYTPHHKNIWAASMHEDGNWYIWSTGGKVLLDPDWNGPITHWMPLPEPPEEVKPCESPTTPTKT